MILAAIIPHLIHAIAEVSMPVPDLRITVSSVLDVRFRQISSTGFGIIFYQQGAGTQAMLVESVQVLNFCNKQWHFRFRLRHFNRQDWTYATSNQTEIDHIMRFIQETNTHATVDFINEDALRYTGEPKKPLPKKGRPAAKSTCEECYGTGFKFGFGAPCSKRCAPCS